MTNSVPHDDPNDEDYAVAMLPGMDAPQKVSVLDLIDPSVPRASKELRAERMGICRGCDRFKMHTFCAECGCTMKFKTWLEPADCPLGKW